MNYIYGAGGHGKVVLDAMCKSNIDCDGFIDDRPISEWSSKPVLPPESISREFALHLAIGNSLVREKLTKRWSHLSFFSVYHPQASLAKNCRVSGLGTFIAAKAIIGPDADVGAHTIVNHAAIVDHDCVIGHFCHIAPGSILGGGVNLSNHVFVGAGAIVLPGIKISDHVTIGAGAVVTKDILEPCTVIGTPAKELQR